MADRKNNHILTQVRVIIANHCGIDQSNITMNTSLSEVLGKNNAAHNLMAIFEKFFGLQIPDAMRQGDKTIGDIVRYIDKHGTSRNLDFTRYAKITTIFANLKLSTLLPQFVKKYSSQPAKLQQVINVMFGVCLVSSNEISTIKMLLPQDLEELIIQRYAVLANLNRNQFGK